MGWWPSTTTIASRLPCYREPGRAPAADAIERAAQPVYAYLEHDPQTKAFIRQIQQMKQRFPAPVPVAAC